MKRELKYSIKHASELYRMGEVFPAVVIAAILPIIAGIEESKFANKLYVHLREIDDFIDESQIENQEKIKILQSIISTNSKNTTEGIPVEANGIDIDLFNELINNELFEKINSYLGIAYLGMIRELRIKDKVKEPCSQLHIDDLRTRAIFPYVLIALFLMFDMKEQMSIKEIKTLILLTKNMAIFGDLRDRKSDLEFKNNRFSKQELDIYTSDERYINFVFTTYKQSLNDVVEFTKEFKSLSLINRLGCSAVIILRNTLLFLKLLKDKIYFHTENFAK